MACSRVMSAFPENQPHRITVPNKFLNVTTSPSLCCLSKPKHVLVAEVEGAPLHS